MNQWSDDFKTEHTVSLYDFDHVYLNSTNHTLSMELHPMTFKGHNSMMATLKIWQTCANVLLRCLATH